MSKIIFPPRLKVGDKVALLSPASTPRNKKSVKIGQHSLEALGLQVQVGTYALNSYGYLAGTDQERARDFCQAWMDPQIKGVFCTRGGYGTARLLEQIRLKSLLEYPKILVGYSDLTIMHLVFQAHGLVSFWGPMLSVYPGLNTFSTQYLQQALMTKKPLGFLPISKHAVILQRGRVEGRLTGGTVSLMAASLGTPYAIDTCGKIVFMEDTGEEPYKIDRMLTQLLAAGKLADAAGILLGQFTHTRAHTYSVSHNFSLAEVFADRLGPLKLPILMGCNIGHIQNQLTIPYGILARMDAGKRTLKIMEVATK